jgi:hypothetical protein
MRAHLKTLMVAALFMAAAAHATTWGDSEVIDPVSGKKVTMQEPMSYGSYIYEWEGKEDQVFWPFTDDHWLWFNPKSGYGAFGGDFKELEKEDLVRMKAWLGEHYDGNKPPRTRLEKLLWLEQLYGQRRMGEGFWCFWYRLMAFELSKEDPARSLEYVRKALPLLDQQLTDAEGFRRIATLYLLGEYHRRLGDLAKSHDYFLQARAVVWKDEDGKEQTGSPYINGIIDEREKLNASVTPAI